MKSFNRLYRGALLVSLLTAAIPVAVADEKGQASRAVLFDFDEDDDEADDDELDFDD